MDAEQANALMQLGELLTPFREFAEGERQKMCERGWSQVCAEQHALVILNGLTRSALRSISK